MPDPIPTPAAGVMDKFVDVAKQQGIAAAVALGLLLALLYQSREITRLSASFDALGDLVISSCMPDPAAVKRFEDARRAIQAGKG